MTPEEFISSIPTGDWRCLRCRNVVGELWKAEYFRKGADDYEALMACSGTWPVPRNLTCEEAIDHARRTMEIINRVADEDGLPVLYHPEGTASGEALRLARHFEDDPVEDLF